MIMMRQDWEGEKNKQEGGLNCVKTLSKSEIYRF